MKATRGSRFRGLAASMGSMTSQRPGARIAILGAGGWGTALGVLLAQQGREVRLWARRAEFAETLRLERHNADYLPGVLLPDALEVTFNLQRALEGASTALVTVPSVGVTSLLEQLSLLEGVPENISLVLCAKGLNEHGESLFQGAVQAGFERLAVLSGPNHAEEVARGLPAATTVAALRSSVALEVQHALHTPSFRVYTSPDVVGVELGGVLKNVIALAAGMLDGLKAGDNAKAALITRGLLEMGRYLKHQGALEDTVYGLSGLGDLIATATSPHSRNRAYGEAFVKNEVAAEGKKVVEGVRTARLLEGWARLHRLDLPIVSAVARVLRGKVAAGDALWEVMERRPRGE